MGSVKSTSRVRSPTWETLSFAYAEVNIISHQPTHFLWYAWALQVCKSYVQANFTDGDRWYTRWGSLILKSLNPQQYHFYYNIVDLVVFLHGVNTSDLSEFNLVERRMAPLFHEIAECYFFTIPLEIIRTQVEKLLTVSWRRTSWRQHEFILNCGQKSQSRCRTIANWKNVCSWDCGCRVGKEARAEVTAFCSNHQMHQF